MSPWDKPNEKLVKLLDDIVSGIEFDKPVDFRPMFGCPAYFTGGNLFAGVWQDTMMLRLSEERPGRDRGRRRAAVRAHARPGDEGVRRPAGRDGGRP